MTASACAEPNDLDRQILGLLANHSYEDVAALTQTSRGKVWKVACRYGARKNEARIRERASERQRRQHEMLQELMNSTATADVLDFLESLPSRSARLAITSPPYNVGKAYEACDDNLSYMRYCGWLYQVVAELTRVVKPGGVLFLQVGSTRDEQGVLEPLDIRLFDALKLAGLTFQSRIVWTVPHGLTPRRRLAERYETALVFSKGEIEVFNPTPARTPQKDPSKRAFKGPNKGKLSSHPLGAHPSNVWADIGNVGHNHPEHTGHPAQFPLELARRAVMLYSMPGDLVVDPFSGAGTTQAACIQTGRAFVGCDIGYEDLRAQRLAEIFPDTLCELPGVTENSLAIWQAEARRVATPDAQIALGL